MNQRSKKLSVRVGTECTRDEGPGCFRAGGANSGEEHAKSLPTGGRRNAVFANGEAKAGADVVNGDG